MTDFLAHLGIDPNTLDPRPLAIAAVLLPVFVAGLCWLRKRKGWTR